MVALVNIGDVDGFGAPLPIVEYKEELYEVLTEDPHHVLIDLGVARTNRQWIKKAEVSLRQGAYQR